MVDEDVGEKVLRELREIREQLGHLRQELGGVKRQLDTGFSTMARTAVETHLAALSKRRI